MSAGAMPVQQLFGRSDQWRKTKHAAALTLTLLLSLTVMKVVVRAPQLKLYLGKSSVKLVGTD